jgi:hypothetical protein
MDDRKLEAVLTRLAKISAGMMWRHGHTFDDTAKYVSFALSGMCLYLNIPATTEVDRLIKIALQKGMNVYYYSDQHMRAIPILDDEVHHFRRIK